MRTEAIDWTPGGAVKLLDQTQLPGDEVFLQIDTIDAMVEAIQSLRVRGAPLIGVAAVMGLAAAARRTHQAGGLRGEASQVLAWLDGAVDALGGARPTAVNLRWAVDQVRRVAARVLADAGDADAGGLLVEVLVREAQRLWDDDVRMCRAIGLAGAARVPSGATVLTVCNTGMLATGGIGTAFGVIRVAHEQGKVERVIACETRPLCQGSRLTAWELARVGIPATVIVDSAAATVMGRRGVDVVIAGADRIAANGDAANKIGTHGLATLARANDIPFYIAAPRSTIDMATATGDAIPIEERSGREIPTADGVDVYNPAFDVTPAALITGIVTDAGVIEPPYDRAIAAMFGGSMARVPDGGGEAA